MHHMLAITGNIHRHFCKSVTSHSRVHLKKTLLVNVLLLTVLVATANLVFESEHAMKRVHCKYSGIAVECLLDCKRRNT
jgi:hypothetical protein